MTFNKINNDTTCDCLINAVIDTNSSFSIKTNVSTIRAKDFISKWDKGDRDATSCRQICSKKGVSLFKYEENHEDVIKVFKEMFPISPSYKPYINIIRLYEDSGLVAESPSKRNPFHCDFYQSDDFDYRKVIQIESISLANV